MSDVMQGGELILKALAAEGNTHIFGICDATYTTMIRHAPAYGQTFVAPRHESAGVHMADAMARTTGRPGVVIAGMGPGVANMLPGVVCAGIEGIPVLVLATQRQRRTHSSAKRGRFQYTPQIEFFRPATKFAMALADAQRIPEAVREAYRVAMEGRPGPVYLEIPWDVMNEEVPVERVSFPEPAQYRFAPRGGDSAEVAHAADVLVNAEKPVILAGSGVYRARAQAQLTAFAERHGLPVLTSFGARGVIPEDHDLSLTGNSPSMIQAANEADVVLVLGSSIGEPLEFGRGGSMLWGDADAKTWIQVDADPGAIGCNRSVDIGVVGDVRRVMEQLDGAIAERGGRTKENALAEHCSQHQDLRRALTEEILGNDTVPVHPGRMVAEVRRFFPRESIACFDGGNTTIWNGFYNAALGQECLWTSKFGHLGTGLPYAMGAKLAQPEKPVFLVTGDGALGFNIQELETCAREGINVVVVVNSDYQWGMEIPLMESFFPDKDAVPLADQSRQRWDIVAQGFGCHGEYVTDPTELQPALERATQSGKPAVVQVVTDREINAHPPGIEMLLSIYGENY